MANNPSMIAIAAACKKLGAKVEDIELLSIGAGQKPPGEGYIPRTIFGWGAFLIEAFLTGAASSMHQYFSSSLPLKRYVRIQFPSQTGWHLDSVSAMKQAEVLWEPDIQTAIQIVKDF